MKGKERRLSPQELKTILLDERKAVSKKMENYDLANPDQSGFSNLNKWAYILDQLLETLQSTIEPEKGHGVVSEDGLKSIKGPESNRFKKKE